MAKKIKMRTQLRLGDVYRKLVTDELVKINHIEELRLRGGNLVVKFDTYERRRYNCLSESGAFDEKLLRNAIKEVNKYISEVH